MVCFPMCITVDCDLPVPPTRHAGHWSRKLSCSDYVKALNKRVDEVHASVGSRQQSIIHVL